MRTDPIPPVPAVGENGSGGGSAAGGEVQGRLRALDSGAEDPISALGSQRFTNRELSWLEFGARLLDLADDERVPLLERVKFLAIFSEGLDEFFQVRVAGLKDQVDAGLRARSADGLRPSETLRAIGTRVSELVARQSHIFVDEIAPELAAAGIRLSDWS
jgi:polyphosphate kinase